MLQVRWPTDDQTIKAVGEYFAFKIPLCTQLELMTKHIPISVSSAVVSLVVESYLCGIYGVGIQR